MYMYSFCRVRVISCPAVSSFFLLLHSHFSGFNPSDNISAYCSLGGRHPIIMSVCFQRGKLESAMNGKAEKTL